MKILLLSLLFFSTATLAGLAQKTVSANDIMAAINRKQTISYQNITIVGDLDLTNLANRREIRDGSWRGGAQMFLSTVDVPITFRNCTFKGKFLAYRAEPEEERKLINMNDKVYNTDFTEAVIIEGCQFTDNAAFKYSTFSQQAMFINNTFQEVALFKYSKFRNAADFSGSTFRGHADFKYTMFDEAASFQKVTFDRYADFKYTKFDERVDFGQARFTSIADFKYTQLPRDTNFGDTRFNGSSDFKYATLDGRKFSPNMR